MLKNIKMTLLFFGLLSGFGLAQENMVLTLEKSIVTALGNNLEIKIAEKEVMKARAGVWEAYSAILPSIDASSSFQHAWEIQTSRVPNFMNEIFGDLDPTLLEYFGMGDMESSEEYIEIAFGLENTWLYGVQLNQPLFLGGAGLAGIQMAYADRRANNHQLESKKQQIVYYTTDAFYSCLLAKEVISVQEEALKQAEANLDIVLKKYKVGSASGFDKMRAEVEVANLKPELITARNRYQTALTGLRTICGLEKNVDLEVQGIMEFKEDEFGQVSLDELRGLANKNRQELAAFQARKTIAAKGIVMARSQFLPKAFFHTDYSFMAMRNDYQFTQDDFSKGFTSALSLQIPLFHGLKNCKQYQKARLDYHIMLDSEKQLLDGIGAEVEIGYNKFQEAREKYQSANESVALAQEALRLANLMYEEGASTQLDVLSSQLALTRARLNYAMALYEYQMARYGLRRVTGLLKSML